MRQIIKREKDGQDVKFICSICGRVVYKIFILDGNGCEIDWDDLPDICSCGTKLTNGQYVIDVDKPIMEISSENIRGNVRDNIYKHTHETMPRSTHENSDIYKRYMSDFENAMSVDYFDMRLNGLKRGNLNVPNNIDNLRMECIKRNISHIESCIKKSLYEKDENSINELKEILNILREKHDDMSEKYENKKDFDKRRHS